MNLQAAIDSYLSLRRSLGAVFLAETRILQSFGRAIGDIPIDTIDVSACRAFCRGSGPPTRWWERKHYTLRDFFAFLVSRGDLAAVPLPEAGPKLPRCFEPYVYSRDEIQRLLNATSLLEDKRSPLQHITFRTLLLVLYAAGLRPSEGLHLRCCDVDLGERLLAIWDTKFFKSRLVPVGIDLAMTLESYRKERLSLPMLAGTRSVFFATQAGEAISLGKLERVFARLRVRAGIECPSEGRQQPRLHDLRHAFAVHRLIAWYREGVDVQACLPLLATYLGHVNVSGTQTYLTMTPDLLAVASARFERYTAVGKERQDHG
jgi:site-specific recombinase XerD